MEFPEPRDAKSFTMISLVSWMSRGFLVPNNAWGSGSGVKGREGLALSMEFGSCVTK